MSWRWFAVKTLYRIEASGQAIDIDSLYNPDTTLVEERIVLLKARNAEEAIRKAETEANTYAGRMKWQNAYGETITQRYLGACDSFELFDQPAPRVEVFSTNRLVSRTTTDEEIVDQVFGPKESSESAQRRFRFLNDRITREFTGRASG